MAQDEPADEDAPDEATEQAQEHDEGSAWSWWLLVIPIIAVIDLAVVLLYGANVLVPSDLGDGVELFHIVIAGVIVLAILLIAEIALILGRHPDHLEDEEEPAPGPARQAAREGEPPEWEAVETDDQLDGKHVVEVSRPPKWAVDAGVYATTYVEVTDDDVLRLEEIVALRP